MREDYIMRQIAALARVLARIVGLHRTQQHDEAMQAIEQAVHELLGMSSALVVRVPAAELVATLRRDDPEGGRDKSLLLAALLREAGNNHAARGEIEQTAACHLAALQLRLEAGDDGSSLPEFAPDPGDLAEELDRSGLPFATALRLLLHHEGRGAYARAENLLFDILETHPGDPAVVGAGRAFYERLEAASDAALAAGDLPRAEVGAGRAELERRAALESTNP